MVGGFIAAKVAIKSYAGGLFFVLIYIEALGE